MRSIPRSSESSEGILKTTLTGNIDPNGSNRPKKKKRNQEQIWTDEQRRGGIESRGLAYPNLVALGGYGGGMKISTDENDSGEVLPAVKQREQRRRRGSSPASRGSNLEREGEEDARGNEI